MARASTALATFVLYRLTRWVRTQVHVVASSGIFCKIANYILYSDAKNSPRYHFKPMVLHRHLSPPELSFFSAS